MEEVETIANEPVQGRELTRIEVWAGRLKWWLGHKLPHLVWPGEEVDVHITFKDIGALEGKPSPAVWEAQKLFGKMGIGFDTGSGFHGRDWEWDWSLSGPISVTFCGKAKRPERRTLAKKPKLKVVS